MHAVRLLVVSGSERAGSLNRRLADAAAARARREGAQVDTFDLRALALPVYDGDLQKEQGVPQGVRGLRDALLASDALLLVTPEYNGFPPPLVINAFDWLSRLDADGAAVSGLASTANMPIGLMSASPGLLGGLRSLNFTRQYLSMTFAMLPVPQQFALSRAHEAFDDAGALKDTRAQASMEAVVGAVLRLAAAMKAAGT
jgi:chromate reductase